MLLLVIVIIIAVGLLLWRIFGFLWSFVAGSNTIASSGSDSIPVSAGLSLNGELVQENNLEAYKHTGFWQAMDTLREKNLLQKLWQENKAPWKVW